MATVPSTIKAKAKIVYLGQGVQPRQRVREAEQADRARQKEERARRDGGNGEDVNARFIARPFRLEYLALRNWQRFGRTQLRRTQRAGPTSMQRP